MSPRRFSRRQVFRAAGAAGLCAAAGSLLPARVLAATPAGTLPGELCGPRIDLTVAQTELVVDGRRARAMTINGTLPGPLLRLKEGQPTLIRVTNRLAEDTSIHWHGLLVPAQMDGVPGLSFDGIKPGETFEYRFTPVQYGTYWYHSHSGLQLQVGHYGPLVIEPANGTHPYPYEREYFIVISDWTFERPGRVLARLKKSADYYNFQRQTAGEFFSDVSHDGLGATLADRARWARMRMDRTDLLDVNGSTYTYLINGRSTDGNWTGEFRPGERVLLHFINSGANSIFDVRVPGLPMQLVQASGQHVEPVEVDELRIGSAETWSVIVRPPADAAYAVFAEAIDRKSSVCGTLAPRVGMRAPVPPRRKRPRLTMKNMGMEGMEGMQGGMEGMQGMEGMEAAASGAMGAKPMPQRRAKAGAVRTTGLRPPGTEPEMLRHDEDRHGPGNAMIPMMVTSRLRDPGIGLGGDGWRVLTLSQLRSRETRATFTAPTREIELHLTGNMERFMWSMDGVPFEKARPIGFEYGERVRLTMINDTMMHHPMHLHGMWMELENGQLDRIPRVHTVTLQPTEHVSVLITADAPGRWAFHCHLLYHMHVGMFRVVEVPQPRSAAKKGGTP